MDASKRWNVVGVMALGMFMVVLDNTIVGVALPQMQIAFQTSFDVISWVATVYFLAQAAMIPIIGYLSDLIGSKRIFLASMALFTLSSLLCALSPTKEALITFRVFQGLGGGALLPIVYAIIYRTFPSEQRGTATSLLGIPLLLAPAFGPVLGGYLSTSINWNAIFMINVPTGIVALIWAFIVLPEDTIKQVTGVKKHLDIQGLFLAVIGFTVLVYGITEAGAIGWGNPLVLTSILIGIVILAAFVVVELRVSDPVVDLRLFLNYTFSVSNILMCIVMGLLFASLFLIPFFFENVQGNTPLVTGGLLIATGVANGGGIAIAGRLYKTVGPRILIVLGLLLLIGGTYGLTQVNVNTTGDSLQVWLILRGLGMGLIYQPLQTLMLTKISNKAMAKASSLVSSARQVAGAIGIAVMTTYLTQRTATRATEIGNAIQAGLRTNQFTGVATTCIQNAAVGPTLDQRALGACVLQHAQATGIADTFWLVTILYVVCILLALVVGDDPVVQAHQKAQAHKRGVDMAGIRNVISTLTTNGEEAIGPEILLWHYPNHDIVNGSLLTVESNHFCVLKSRGVIINVYEVGQHTVYGNEHPLVGSIQQEFFPGQNPWQYEALYINRAKLLIKTDGLTLSREMAEMVYTIDYYISIATREQAVQLVQFMPSHGQLLNIHEVNAYAKPMIERAVNELIRVTPLEQVNGKTDELADLVHRHLKQFLGVYGITVEIVKVQIAPRDERIKTLLALKAFGLSELDAIRYYTAVRKDKMDNQLRQQQEEVEQNLYVIWRKTLEHYAHEIATIQADLDGFRADLGPRIGVYSARLQELRHAITKDIRSGTPDLNDDVPPSESELPDTTGQRAVVLPLPDRSLQTLSRRTGSPHRRLSSYR